ncbi:hypothetical protein Pcinc_020880 [Petrolisthes cinctipes]|uniref:Uncharacterized protein n=1 Tax=Petrolisthes cinctipes TaxID=88211 RepID=A0AAE1FI91_PETCI|nr:hypothetical protein Pcinc_020880 [Petrolisthes cinctipes]
MQLLFPPFLPALSPLLPLSHPAPSPQFSLLFFLLSHLSSLFPTQPPLPSSPSSSSCSLTTPPSFPLSPLSPVLPPLLPTLSPLLPLSHPSPLPSSFLPALSPLIPLSHPVPLLSSSSYSPCTQPPLSSSPSSHLFYLGYSCHVCLPSHYDTCPNYQKKNDPDKIITYPTYLAPYPFIPPLTNNNNNPSFHSQ